MVEKPVIQCRVTHVIMVLKSQGRHYAGFPYRFVQDGDLEAYTNHFWCCYYKVAISKQWRVVRMRGANAAFC